ncbi:lantibiotic dehydratase [Amycolatopsis sp. lyj-108]|uniref:lantibiotic dehydratase n=1 Tax=Amycolatopsis sp. lyj-108 TaxID=2789286 RepID=UPI00397AC3CA
MNGHGVTGIGEVVQLRLNPLPGLRLSTPEIRERLTELAREARIMAGIAEAACAELYDLIGTAEGACRTRLLNLRRTIHNSRVPGAADWVEQPPPVTAKWLRAQRRYQRIAHEVTALVPEAEGIELAKMRAILDDSGLLNSLALVTPGVYTAAVRYAKGHKELDQRDRKSERGIVQYLTRAMVRTSPLARFTAVGLYTVDPDGVAVDQPDLTASGAKSFVSVDRALFSYVCGGLVEPSESFGSDVALKGHPTATVEDNRLTYSRPDGDSVRLLATPLTEPLHVLLTQTGLGARRTDELVADVADQLEVPVEHAAAVVAAAVRAGVLIPDSPVDDQAADIVADAIEVLRDTNPRAVRLCRDLGGQLEMVAVGDTGDRVAALGAVKTIENELTSLSGRPARLQVNEDLQLPSRGADFARVGPALGDLAAMIGMRSIFDRQHDVRAILTAAAVDQFGVGFDVGLTTVAQNLVTMVYRRENALDGSTAAELGPRDGSLARLIEVRSELITRLARDITENAGAEELVLDPGGYSGFELPERFARTPASYSALLQVLGEDRLILNDLYPGHGMTYTRFLGHDKAIGGTAADLLKARLRRLYGPHLAEDHGLHDANINHRIRLLDRTVGPQDWSRVRLKHDPDTDDLSLADERGEPLVVLPLGMKWPEVLPEPLRIASWMFDTGRLVTDAVDVAHRRVAPDLGTVGYPRVCFGDVVMHRRRWYHGDDLPPRAGGAAERLLDWTEWRARNGVPEQIVAKTPISGEDLSELDEHTGQLSYLRRRRRAKPQYVDLTSLTMLRVLPKMLERRDDTYFEEALPGIRDGRHAFEWVVEFDRPAHGTFAAEVS